MQSPEGVQRLLRPLNTLLSANCFKFTLPMSVSLKSLRRHSPYGQVCNNAYCPYIRIESIMWSEIQLCIKGAVVGVRGWGCTPDCPYTKTAPAFPGRELKIYCHSKHIKQYFMILKIKLKSIIFGHKICLTLYTNFSPPSPPPQAFGCLVCLVIGLTLK